VRRKAVNRLARTLAILGLSLSFITLPSSIPVASAANPSCTPTASGANATRWYVFTNSTACSWTVPAGWSSFSVELLGGGGGGGGGSWAGTTGGGGGGGGIGAHLKKSYSATEGASITITIGQGGSAGAGAASQGSTNGGNGGDGGTSSIVISASDSLTAIGGSGGQGGSSDTGGAGGTGQLLTVDNSTFGPTAGGGQNSGNGGAGGAPLVTPTSATSSNPGASGYISSVGGFFTFSPGGGGARTGTNIASGYENRNSSGGSSVYQPRSAPTNSGGAGGGGAGCAGSLATCANRSGAAGAAGFVIIYRTFTAVISGQNLNGTGPSTNTGSYAVGVAPTFPTFSTIGAIGNVTWTVDPALPAGLTLNGATGVISGVPTAPTPWARYWLYATDSYGYVSANGWDLVVNKGPGVAPTFTGGNLVYGVPTALTATGGGGTGAISFTSGSSDCVLSGTRGETVTAQKSSGSCLITAQKAGDTNYYAASTTSTFTMTKQISTISISVSPASPREAGTAITITATVGAGQTGSVTFNANGSAISSCGISGVVAVSGTSATCNWIPNSSGSPYTLTASYPGDSNYQSANSNSVSYTIYPSIGLTYAGLSTTFGSAKSVTPVITGGTGSTSSWSWTIAKASDLSAVSGISISNTGVVTASGSTAVGSYSMQVTATDTVGVTKSALVTVVVGLSNAASPAISSDVTSITAGGTAHLTANVISAATGTMAFKVGGSTISGCGSVAISSGSATCDWIPSTATGSPFSLTVVYSGDSSYSTATSSSISVAVVAPGTFTYTSQSKVFGTSVSVAPSISGGTGSFSSWSVLKVSDSSTVSGVYINSSGVVTISSVVSAGTYLLGISANDQFGVAGTGTLSVTITQATTTIALSAQTISGVTLSGGTLGRQVRLVVTPNVPIGGNVVISDAVGSICTVYVYSGSSECWWAPSDASRSPYALTATFAGNANATAATSNTLSNFIWNQAMSVTHANSSVETGKTLTISPTVSGGTGAPSTWAWGISQYFTGYSIGGITINSSGVIRVAGSVAPGTYAMVVSSADLAGSYFYNNVTITISDVLAPRIALNSSSETVTVGSQITGFTITNTGSDITSFSIDQSLPAGLSFNTATGALSGTPTETTTALVITLTARNFGGVDTATYTLTITPGGGGGGGGGATITISLPGGAVIAAKGTPVTITAAVSVAGIVKFFANGKVIGGCAAKSASSSATCSWTPSVQGQAVALTAILKPTSISYSTVKSAALTVGVGRRTGRR
jgi:hypothetical protein